MQSVRVVWVAFVAVLVVTLCVVGLNFTALVITSSDTRPVAASSSARPASSSSGARPARANNAPQEDTIEQYRPPAFELTADAAALGQRTVSCPLYSGPGYNKLRHASREISVPAFEAPFVARPKPPEMKLEPLPPADVRLRAGSSFEAAFRTNHQYLLSVDTDALLLSWRLNAPGGRWPKGSFRLMGWEHTGSELRGHFLGHWLSAAAITFAATGDRLLEDRMREVVERLSGVGQAHASGYLSAFPESFLERLEAITQVWAPYYTIHKLLAGLLQQFTLAGSASALALSERLAAYIDGRVQKLIASKSLHYHFETLNQECGGINEGLWTLAALTDQPRHRSLASLFDKPCLLGPLAGGRDELSGMHGNTALALLLGAARRYEVTGEAHFHSLSSRFFAMVQAQRTFATGGSTANELWEKPGLLGHTVSDDAGPRAFEHAESCTTHNMVRLASKLLRASGGELRYADFIERALLNGVMGTQRGEEPGAARCSTRYSPLTTHYSPHTTHYSPHTTRHTLLTTHHSLLATH